MKRLWHLLILILLFSNAARTQPQPDSIQAYKISGPGGDSITNFVIRNTFNSNGELIEALRDYHGGDDPRTNYAYQDGRLVFEQDGYMLYGGYTALSHVRTYYDDRGRDTLKLRFAGDSSGPNPEIVYGLRKIFVDDSLGRITEETHQLYTSLSKTFVNSIRYRRHFPDSSMYPDTTWEYTFYGSPSNSYWNPFRRHIYSGWVRGWEPNILDFNAQYIRHDAVIDGVMQPFTYDTIRYYGFGRTVLFHHESDTIVGSFLKSTQTYAYDFRKHLNLDEYVLFTNTGEVLNSKSHSITYEYNSDFSVRVYIDSNYNSNGYVEAYKYVCFYQGQWNGIRDKVQQLRVYPNPVSPNGTLFLSQGNWMKAALYSLDGKKIFTWTLPESNALLLPEVVPGLYLLRCTDVNGKSYQSKIQIR